MKKEKKKKSAAQIEKKIAYKVQSMAIEVAGSKRERELNALLLKCHILCIYINIPMDKSIDRRREEANKKCAYT